MSQGNFTLYYNTARKIPQALSNTYWSTNLDYTLTDGKCFVNKNTGELICSAKIYQRPDGSTLTFDSQSGGYVESGGGGLATLTYDSASSTYILHDEDATTKVFDTYENIKSITDSSGIGWTIAGSGPASASTYTVTHSSGKSYSVTRNSSDTITVTDPSGNAYVLHLTNDGNYTSITYPGSPATTVSFKYGLSALPGLLTEVDYNGAPYDYTSYNTNSSSPYYGWATANYLADNSESATILYAKDAAGNLQATITNALGHHRVQTYDGTNGPGGTYNGQLSAISDDAVADCGATIRGRSYDANGNLSKEVDNNGNVHTYTYAATGQLQSETEAAGTSLARTTDYTWDSDLRLNRLTSVTVEGWSKTTYTYNAQNRLASVSVTNLSGNGSANQTLTTTYGYTLYASGMVHVMTVTHPSPGNSDVDTYTFDALGNLTSRANGLGQATTFSNYNGLGEPQHVVGPNGDVTDYSYDARGRVATKTTHPNGVAATWTYGYDGYGQLASLAVPDGETTAWNHDAEMRVTSIVRNDKDGASTESFGYDANGDVTSHTVSRNGTPSLSETLSYDALGRLYKRQGNHGQLLTYGYDGNGNVLTVTDATGHTVSNQYDALNRVTKTISSGGASPALPSGVPNLSVPANNANGNYSVSWSGVTGAASYVLQQRDNGGAWTTVQDGTATSWAATGKSDGTYSYRVRACNVTGCGAWSGVASVIVQRLTPPPAPASVSVPATSSGNVAVSWPSSSTATSYTLQHRLGTGSWNTVYSGGNTSTTVTESATGSYTYQVQACGAGGCSGWTGSGTVAVTVPPASAPNLSVPSSNSTGSYTVSWTGIGGATSYTLQGQVNGGSWGTIQASSSTSRGESGKGNGTYGYRVQACNAGGCGPWSGAGSVTVLRVPATPAGLSATVYKEFLSDTRPPKTTYTLTATWSSVAGASSYNFNYCQPSGSCPTQSVATPSVPDFYVQGGAVSAKVQACNASGCSAWSAVVTPTVVNE
ncbi:hypothetical protein [Rhodanobacter glycinis]|uniref:YD repeat-containing protein n=1 Tax=Rhodanobacter glycinis TaxID=582702 RepID=A0A1I4C6D2_9GAMM|nr:hypothetical protein [Rhodanobacter glycinis]SFK75849.1 YD repeat-containing protein [Rhodanobacter glycinis]